MAASDQRQPASSLLSCLTQAVANPALPARKPLLFPTMRLLVSTLGGFYDPLDGGFLLSQRRPRPQRTIKFNFLCHLGPNQTLQKRHTSTACNATELPDGCCASSTSMAFPLSGHCCLAPFSHHGWLRGCHRTRHVAGSSIDSFCPFVCL